MTSELNSNLNSFFRLNNIFIQLHYNWEDPYNHFVQLFFDRVPNFILYYSRPTLCDDHANSPKPVN